MWVRPTVSPTSVLLQQLPLLPLILLHPFRPLKGDVGPDGGHVRAFAREQVFDFDENVVTLFEVEIYLSDCSSRISSLIDFSNERYGEETSAT